MHKNIFWNFRNSGFGSCFNTMVLAYVYAQHHKYNFILFSQDSNICIKDGWTDYFLPFSETQNTYSKDLDIDNFLPLKTIWNDKFAVNCFTSCQIIAREIWHFNKEVQVSIDNKIKALNIPKKYICLHIRRGDKLREIEGNVFANVSEYIELAKNKSSVIDYFVMTDDVRVVAELENKYKNYRFYTLSDTQIGFKIETFNDSSKQFRYDSTIALLADIEIAKKSDMFVGTYTSNIFRLVSLFKEWSQMQAIDCKYDQLFTRSLFPNIPKSRLKYSKLYQKIKYKFF